MVSAEFMCLVSIVTKLVYRERIEPVYIFAKARA